MSEDVEKLLGFSTRKFENIYVVLYGIFTQFCPCNFVLIFIHNIPFFFARL